MKRVRVATDAISAVPLVIDFNYLRKHAIGRGCGSGSGWLTGAGST